MGSNRRYAKQIDQNMNDRVVDFVARGTLPDTLNDDELALDREPLTRIPIPRQVKAWVRYDAVSLLVDAELVAWTPRAAAIRWKVGDSQHRAWVWVSAVFDQ